MCSVSDMALRSDPRFSCKVVSVAMGTTRVRGTSRQLEQRAEGGQATKRSHRQPALLAKSPARVCSRKAACCNYPLGIAPGRSTQQAGVAGEELAVARFRKAVCCNYPQGIVAGRSRRQADVTGAEQGGDSIPEGCLLQLSPGDSSREFQGGLPDRHFWFNRACNWARWACTTSGFAARVAGGGSAAALLLSCPAQALNSPRMAAWMMPNR
ncbi:hypothetical protein D3C84_248840 [compost metagenome]